MIIREAPREHYPWLADRAKAGVDRAMEVVDGDRILGMVGFSGTYPNAVMLSIALDSPIAGRLLLRHAFRYIFETEKRGVAIATVLSSNARAMKLDSHLGFREVFRGKDWWEPGTDMVWLEMRKEDCRWLKE